MILPDVNVLVYAHRADMEDHSRYRKWLEGVRASDEPFGLSDLVLAGFVRVVTHRRIFKKPTPQGIALSFASDLRNSQNCVNVSPGPRHFDIFVRLCGESGAQGNLVQDAFLAALAIESGCEWVTTDRDFSRFPGLKWRKPL